MTFGGLFFTIASSPFFFALKYFFGSNFHSIKMMHLYLPKLPSGIPFTKPLLYCSTAGENPVEIPSEIW